MPLRGGVSSPLNKSILPFPIEGGESTPLPNHSEVARMECLIVSSPQQYSLLRQLRRGA